MRDTIRVKLSSDNHNNKYIYKRYYKQQDETSGERCRLQVPVPVHKNQRD